MVANRNINMMLVEMMCTDEKDIEELNDMSGPLCWQGYDKDPGVVWNRQGIHLQGHIYMVQMRKGKRYCLHALRFEQKMDKKTSQLDYSGQRRKGDEENICNDARTYGQRGTTTPYMPGCRMNNKQTTFRHICQDAG